MPLTDELPTGAVWFEIARCSDCGRNSFYVGSFGEKLAPDCAECGGALLHIGSGHIDGRGREKSYLNLAGDPGATLGSVVDDPAWR